jgi:GNAT superfamily N-acetyltransferase
MTIRRATEDDLEIICALIIGLADYEELRHEVEWTPEELRTHLFAPDSPVKVELAIDPDGQAVGMALWYPTFSTFLGRSGIWLEDLFVVPEARGAGHGLALLQHLRSLTTGRVEWSVLDWNEPSIRFYQSLGAKPVDGWTRYRWTLDPIS